MIHELKIFSEFFNAVISGEKTFEIRKNDRPYHKGDLLALNEFDGQYWTGNSCLVYVDYIFDNPDYVKKDMIIMGIKPCTVCRHTDPFVFPKLAKGYSVPLATKCDEERRLGLMAENDMLARLKDLLKKPMKTRRINVLPTMRRPLLITPIIS